MASVRWVSKEEVSKHSTDEDMWIIIHGRAYDVTNFQYDHPGGPDILAAHAGVDGTEEFEDTFHSVVARKMLDDMFVGNVLDMEQTDYLVQVSHSSSSLTSSQSSNLFLLLPLLVILFALYYKYYSGI